MDMLPVVHRRESALRLSLYEAEVSEACQWAPAAHQLEFARRESERQLPGDLAVVGTLTNSQFTHTPH